MTEKEALELIQKLTEEEKAVLIEMIEDLKRNREHAEPLPDEDQEEE